MMPFLGDVILNVIGIAVTAENKTFIQSRSGNDTFFELPEKYKPIPLNEEWLVKFGFEKDKSAFIYGYYALYNNEIYWSGGVYSACDSISNIEIKYVHQLQNLIFALTGEELTLKP